MDSQLKQEWIDALRSGKYEQGHGALRSPFWDDNSETLVNHKLFCCLGVLCDVVDPKGWDKDGSHALEAESGPYIASEDLERLGLKQDMQYMLARVNDESTSFEEIADIIEAKV